MGRDEPASDDSGVPVDRWRGARGSSRQDRCRHSRRHSDRIAAGPSVCHLGIPAVRISPQHRRAAVPRGACDHGRRAEARSVAHLAHGDLHRRHRSLGRDQPLCDDRHRALRVLGMSADLARHDRRARLLVAGVIAIGVVIRLLGVRAQGFTTDVGTFQAWAERLAQIGPGRFYEPGYFSDYPPAFLYVLWLLGAMFDGEFLRLAVKAISIPADIAIAILAARLVWRTAGRTAGIAAAALWSLQPGAIFAGPHW